jgi:hypothetical protein
MPIQTQSNDAMSASAKILVVISLLMFALTKTEAGPLDEMAHADTKSLRFYADVSIFTPLPIDEPKEENNSGKSFAVHAYIQNISPEKISILLGSGVDILHSQPSSDSLSIHYYISESRIGETAIKPSLTVLNPVSLSPNEIAELPVARITVKQAGQVNKIQVIYSVSPKLGEWYNVWSGELRLVLDKSKPPPGATR